MWYYFGHLQFSFHVHVMSQHQHSFMVISRLYFESVNYFYFMADLLREWNCKVHLEGFSPHFIYCSFKPFKGVFLPISWKSVPFETPLDEEGVEIQ